MLLVNPARAGMIPSRSGPGLMTACKPRASGDDPRFLIPAPQQRNVNPARAGMIRRSSWRRSASTSKPRASGDDPPSKGAKNAMDE